MTEWNASSATRSYERDRVNSTRTADGTDPVQVFVQVLVTVVSRWDRNVTRLAPGRGSNSQDPPIAGARSENSDLIGAITIVVRCYWYITILQHLGALMQLIRLAGTWALFLAFSRGRLIQSITILTKGESKT